MLLSHPRVTFATAPSTLVEITLEERAEGTLLTLVESGFASLPQPIPAEEAYQRQPGWLASVPERVACLPPEPGSRIAAGRGPGPLVLLVGGDAREHLAHGEEKQVMIDAHAQQSLSGAR